MPSTALPRNAALKMYLPLDSAAGLTDLSGQGNNGTANGGMTVGGVIGGDGVPPESTNLDGTNDIITTGYNPFKNGNILTLLGWAKREGETDFDIIFAGDDVIGDGGGTEVPCFELVTAQSDGRCRPRWYWDVAADFPIYQDWDYDWPVGIWHHWALLIDTTTNDPERALNLYIDGDPMGPPTISPLWAPYISPFSSDPGNIEFGARSSQVDSESFDGKMAHLAIYEAALSPAEIRAVAYEWQHPTRIYPHPSSYTPTHIHVPGHAEALDLDAVVTGRRAFDEPDPVRAQMWAQAGSIRTANGQRHPMFTHGPVGGQTGADSNRDVGASMTAETLSFGQESYLEVVLDL